MNKISLGLLVAAITLAQDASADSLQTTFAFQLNVGGVITPLAFPTSEGKRISLPVVLNDWNCLITDIHRSDDGKSIYHNIVCDDTRPPYPIIGVSVICPIQSEAYNSAGFFLRDGNVQVEINGSCMTIKSKTKLQSGTTL